LGDGEIKQLFSSNTTVCTNARIIFVLIRFVCDIIFHFFAMLALKTFPLAEITSRSYSADCRQLIKEFDHISSARTRFSRTQPDREMS